MQAWPRGPPRPGGSRPAWDPARPVGWPSVACGRPNPGVPEKSVRPASTPWPRGEYATTTRPVLSAKGTSSSAGLGAASENCTWFATTGARIAASASCHWARVKFETPARRTSPSSTSGRTACMTRRADTNGFFQCTYRRSSASMPRRRREPAACHATIGSAGAMGVNLVATISPARCSSDRRRQGLADDPLGSPRTVHLGGVQHRDAELRRPFDQPRCDVRRVAGAVSPLSAAELPGSQADAGEPHPLDLDVAHDRSILIDRPRTRDRLLSQPGSTMRA